MAGNAKDLVKRSAVKKFLRKKEHRELSDREVAKECGCGRFLVKTVRMELIAVGQHEPIDENRHGGHDPKYQPGAVVRGGYVWGFDLRPVREIEFIRQQEARKRRGRQVGA